MKFHDSRSRPSARRVPGTRPETARPHKPSSADEILRHVESEEPTGSPVEQARILCLDDFVFLSARGKCWLIRTADIWLLEACGARTRVYTHPGLALVRRTLDECERRLDDSIFFRATRDCIINLTHVRQTRLLDCSRVLFELPNGKQVIVSGTQNAVFRKMRAL
jgi:two-component system, LytTR family, response regulator